MKKIAKAFAPAGISSFFEICNKTNMKAPNALEHIGSRGGGFGLQKGVFTEVYASESETNTSNINVFINGTFTPEAQTTKSTLQLLLNNVNSPHDVNVKHFIDVPIGAGFGTSAGGALTAGLALKAALDLPLTYNQIGKAAHVAEIQCQTGLGTVSPLMVSGCVLVLEPGAPGISVIDRIPLSSDHVVVVGVFGPTPTKQVLNSPEKHYEVNRYGKKTLECILANPSLENFLSCCWDFAEKTGFTTERVKNLFKLAKDAGAIGAAQNMVGEAVHAIVFKENAMDVAEAFKQVLPTQNIFMSQIDFQGVRLV